MSFSGIFFLPLWLFLRISCVDSTKNNQGLLCKDGPNLKFSELKVQPICLRPPVLFILTEATEFFNEVHHIPLHGVILPSLSSSVCI